nr:MAG TPA: hypothetical protein [Caudoviricetes sp.]
MVNILATVGSVIGIIKHVTGYLWQDYSLIMV